MYEDTCTKKCTRLEMGHPERRSEGGRLNLSVARGGERKLMVWISTPGWLALFTYLPVCLFVYLIFEIGSCRATQASPKLLAQASSCLSLLRSLDYFRSHSTQWRLFTLLRSWETTGAPWRWDDKGQRRAPARSSQPDRKSARGKQLCATESHCPGPAPGSRRECWAPCTVAFLRQGTGDSSGVQCFLQLSQRLSFLSSKTGILPLQPSLQPHQVLVGRGVKRPLRGPAANPCATAVVLNPFVSFFFFFLFRGSTFH